MHFCCVGGNVCVSSTAVSCWCSESVQEVKNATACATEAVTERESNIQNFHTSSTYLKGKLVVYHVGFITLWKFFRTLLSVTHTTNTAPVYIQQGLGGQLGSVKQPVLRQHLDWGTGTLGLAYQLQSHRTIGVEETSKIIESSCLPCTVRVPKPRP